MRRALLPLASLVVAMACWAAPAQGQAPAGDSVTGNVQELALPGFLVTWTFAASSGPQGENPTGTVQNEFLGTGSVSCLSVEGNRAVIGAAFPGVNFLISVVDSDAPDLIGYVGISGPPITVCPPPGGHEDRFITSGNLTVVDAQPFPSSKGQCENGGWRSFPQFKNQGRCIAFVNHGP